MGSPEASGSASSGHIDATHLESSTQHGAAEGQQLQAQTAEALTSGASVLSSAQDLSSELQQDAAAWKQQQHWQQQQKQQGRQQLCAWQVFVQCTMLASAAFAATPLILVLDIAERACLAVCQAKHIQLLATASGMQAPPAAAAPAHVQQQVGGAQAAFNSHQAPQGVVIISAKVNPPSGASGTLSASTPSSNSSSKVVRSIRPELLGLLPPWTPMALVTVPGLLLAVRHFSTPGVLQLLLLWAGSLVLQSYGNLLLVMLQRGTKGTKTAGDRTKGMRRAAADGQAKPITSQQMQQQQQREGSFDGQHRASSGMQQPLSSRGWWMPGKGHAHHRSSRSSSSSSSVATASTWLYRALQVAGDAFRVWCLCSVGWLLWQQQAPTVAGAWAGMLASLQHSSSCAAVAMPAGQLVGAAAAAAVKLQHCVSSCVWLGIDVGLVGACVIMYALAVLGRVLPSWDLLL
jgi:hypothetical protein